MLETQNRNKKFSKADAHRSHKPLEKQRKSGSPLVTIISENHSPVNGKKPINPLSPMFNKQRGWKKKPKTTRNGQQISKIHANQ